jgi:hypothetical protein
MLLAWVAWFGSWLLGSWAAAAVLLGWVAVLPFPLSCLLSWLVTGCVLCGPHLIVQQVLPGHAKDLIEHMVSFACANGGQRSVCGTMLQPSQTFLAAQQCTGQTS